MQEITHTQNKKLDALELARMRTRLANRRTFLAWCRTALSFMAFAFLLERLDDFLSTHQTLSDAVVRELGVVGMIAFISGPFIVLLAGIRYYRTERKLGMDGFDRFIMPEILLIVGIMAAALILVFS